MNETLAPKLMPLAYVAGPYRAKTEWQLVQNIREAEDLALELWRMGLAVICPQKNTAHFGGGIITEEGGADDSLWLAGDLVMMLRCDLVVTTDRWQESAGARAEVDIAHKYGIPVAHTLIHAKAFLNGAQARGQI